MRDDGGVSTESSGSPQSLSGRRLFLAGAVTGAAGVATSQATTELLRVETGPVVAVGELVRDLTPGPIAEWLIGVVKHADKPLLIIGTGLGLLVLCGLAGTLVRRHPLLPDLLFLVLAAVAGYAVLRRSGSAPADMLPVLVGWITWVVVLRLLTDMAVRAGEETGLDRRAFLTRMTAVAVGALVVGGLSQLLGRGRRQVEQARRLLRLPVKAGRAPDGVELGVDGVAPWRTPNADFYLIHTAIAIPTVSPADWSLRIHGMVERELVLSYQDLVERQLTEDWITLCCVSNPVGGDLIGNAYWSGVLTRQLLSEAGVKEGADAVKQTSQDGWTCGTPLVAMTDARNAMVALAMNGEPLPIKHGFPARTVVPGLFGYVSATKWLTEWEVTRFDKFSAYWTERGWGERGPVKTESRVDVPRNGASVPAGRLRVGGSAWAQQTGITRVEFQIDGSPWQEADLGAVPGVDTWVQWSGEAEVDKGSHQIAVRATDKADYTQTAVRVDVVPDGATGWHTVEFDAT